MIEVMLVMLLGLAAPVVGAILMGRALAYRRSTTRAACSRCRIRVDARTILGRAACPGCGRAITGPASLTPARGRSMVGLGSAGAGIAVAGVLGAALLGSLMGRGVRPLPPTAMTTTRLAGRLAVSGPPTDYVKDEFAARLAALKDAAELAAVRSAIAAAATARGALPTQPDGLVAAIDLVVRTEQRLGLPPDRAFLDTVMPLWLGAPTLSASLEGPALALRFTGLPLRTSHLPLVARSVIREASVDGKAARLPEGAPFALLPGVSRIGFPLPPGPRPTGGTVKVILELVVFPRFDAARTLDERGGSMPRDSWPEPLWSTELTLTSPLISDSGG
ncbi:MAG: hypothetical protein U0574_08525 [Phycisphaerales bacterium]